MKKITDIKQVVAGRLYHCWDSDGFYALRFGSTCAGSSTVLLDHLEFNTWHRIDGRVSVYEADTPPEPERPMEPRNGEVWRCKYTGENVALLFKNRQWRFPQGGWVSFQAQVVPVRKIGMWDE